MTFTTRAKGPEGSAPQTMPPAAQTGSGPLPLAALFAVLAAGLLASLAVFYGAWYPIHHDLAGVILSARLDAVLGARFDDYSLYFPPAERAWYGLAAGLSAQTGIRLDLAAVLLTGLAVLFSAGLAFHIRRRTAGASALFLVLSCAVLTVLPILYKNMFGVREHMVILGLWPYLVLRISDPDGDRIGWKTRLVVGLWLGATLLLKYFYSLAVLLVELADAAVRRQPFLLLRAENIVAGAIVALYLFVWLGIDPQQREAIGVMLSGLDANLNDPVTNLKLAAMQLVLAAPIMVLARIERVPGRVTAIGLALVAGAVIAAAAQGRYYSHHLFPITMAYFAWIWLMRAALKPLWLGALVLLAAWPVIGEFRGTARYQVAVDEVDQAMQQAGRTVAGKRVGLLNMHPSPFSQYLAAHDAVRWNAGMNNAYVAAELKPLDRPGIAARPTPPVRLDVPGRRLLHEEMLRLWEDMPPDVLILDHSTSWPLEHIEVRWTEVFAQDPRFRSLLAHYRPVFAHKGKEASFVYYERIVPGP